MRYLRELDRLVRIHAFGILAVWPLLGAAASGQWTPRIVIGLLAVAFCFNTFGAVLNDVVDVAIDRTNPLRSRDLIVRGAVSQRLALAVALLQLPLIAAAHAAAGFPGSALPIVLAAAAAMAVYDLWSKRVRVPPLIEASQAAAGALLVVYGAAVTEQTVTPLLWPVGLSAPAFILFINAFHGGLRDIENDRACGQRTTPIWLGCRGEIGSRVHISSAMSLYSGVLQGALIAFALWACVLAGSETAGAQSLIALLVVAALALGNIALFAGEHLVLKPAWDTLLRIHVAVAPLPLLLGFMPRLGLRAGALLLAVYFLPMGVLDRSHLLRLRIPRRVVPAGSPRSTQ